VLSVSATTLLPLNLDLARAFARLGATMAEELGRVLAALRLAALRAGRIRYAVKSRFLLRACVQHASRVRCRGRDGRAGDAVSVEMVPEVSEVSPLTGGTDGISCPSQEHRDLSDVEWTGTVLEHLWNKMAVHRRGPLVILTPYRLHAAGTISVGW